MFVSGLFKGTLLPDLFYLGLRYAEISENRAANTSAAKDKENLRFQVRLVRADEVGVDSSDNSIPQPVGRSRERHTPGADRQGEDLTDDDPSARTPCGREKEDEDADEGHFCRGPAVRVGDVVCVGDAKGGGDEEADDHTASAPEQELAAAKALYHPERWWGANNVDGVCGDLDGKRIADEVREKLRAKIEDEIDAGPLLEHLQCRTKYSATEVGARIEHRAGKAVCP